MSAALLAAVLVITGGTLHPGDGPPVENATIVVEDGVVRSVAAGAPAPAGARVIDAKGKVVTPGFVDPFTALGLVEIWGVDGARDVDAGGDPIRAAFRAVDAFDPDSAVIPVQRAHGVTLVASAPSGGLVSGQIGVFSLGPTPGPVADSVGLVATLGADPSGSRGARALRLREVLEDARAYRANRKGFEENRFRRTAAGRLDLEALVPVVEGRKPLFVRVQRAADIRAVLRIAAEERLRVVVVGGAEAWRVADDLARAKVPVIVDPSENLPSTFDMIHARSDNAALLEKAGVRVLLSTFSVHNVRKLRQWAGNAVRAGMPHAAALSAITARAADAIGATGHGRVAPGKVADVVVWSGDPFEFSSRVEHLIIGGGEVPTTHRQRALFDRYREVPAP